jgi:hypothetical protein
MCDTDDRADVTAAEALPASLEWKGEVLPLEPVDELSVLTVCDNVMDMLLPDEGPAKRLPLGAMARLAPPLEAPAILGGKAADVPLAQHGFSALVEIRKGGRVRLRPRRPCPQRPEPSGPGDPGPRQGRQGTDRQDQLRGGPQCRPLPAGPRETPAGGPAGAVAGDQRAGAGDPGRDLPDRGQCG